MVVVEERGVATYSIYQIFFSESINWVEGKEPYVTSPIGSYGDQAVWRYHYRGIIGSWPRVTDRINELSRHVCWFRN